VIDLIPDTRATSFGLSTYPFKVQVACRHTDLDVQKCINNVAISNLLEEARTQYSLSRKLKAAFDPYRRLIDGLVIRFVSDGRYPAPLDVGIGVLSVSHNGWTLRAVIVQQEQVIAVSDCLFKLVTEQNGHVGLPQALINILERDLLTKQ
jgi:acyl-CoA thioester hydrolase